MIWKHNKLNYKLSVLQNISHSSILYDKNWNLVTMFEWKWMHICHIEQNLMEKNID